MNWFYTYTDYVLPVSHQTTIMKENCRIIRDWIKEYVKSRRNGSRKSDVGGAADILTLMLADQDLFTEEVIADELIGFFGAATEAVDKNS